MDNLWQKVENILHVLCDFFFCHYVFKKSSAAEASESVYTRGECNLITVIWLVDEASHAKTYMNKTLVGNSTIKYANT